MKKVLQTVFLLLLIVQNVSAQDIRISGRILSGEDEAVIGASVVEQGTYNGTNSDIDGSFSVTVSSSSIIEFSFVGMRTQELSVKNLSDPENMVIRLEPDAIGLDNVVIVGYSVQKKSVITGAIASISSDEISSTPVTSAAQALQGKTAGVSVTSNSGSPGSGTNITIRGVGSNGENAPLYIVDGLQMGDIDYLSADDIESIEVLKDAASAAIYGSRGANGVVLVTTKKGSEGAMTISYSGYYGVQSAWRKADVLNATEYMDFHNEGFMNIGGKSWDDRPFLNPDVAEFDTDWQDATFDNAAPIQNHNIQIGGGSDVSTYLFGLSYFSQNGTVGGDKASFERITLRLNGDHKLREFLKFGHNINIVNRSSSSIMENNDHGSVFQNIVLHDPLTPIHETRQDKIDLYSNMPVSPVIDSETGQFYGISEYPLNEIVNPLARIETTWGNNVTQQLMGNVYLEATPVKGLRIKTDFGVDVGTNYNRSYTPEAFYNSQNYVDTYASGQGASHWTNWQWENTAQYRTRIADNHNVDALIGMTARRDEGRGVGASRVDLFLTGWENAWVSNGADGLSSTNSGYNWEHTMLSFFGRVNYNYKEKYMFSAIVRRDGSSRFGDDNKFGTFPSVQAGWVISEESFLEDNSFIYFLKLRGAFGQTGNENIGDFGYIEKFGKTGNYFMGPEDLLISGGAITQMPNSSIRWETAQEFDLGLDMSFLKNSIYVNLDYYNRKRVDLLSTEPVAGYTGVAGPLGNIGTVSNKGFEALVAYNKKFREFSFNISGNIAFNTNMVESVKNTNGYIDGSGAFNYFGNLRMEEGFSLPYFYGYETDGIFQTNAEIQAYTKNNKQIQPTAKPGDIKFVDNNDDGKISQEDRTNIETHIQTLLGITLKADYKNFDFSAFLQGQQGNKIVNVMQRIDKLSFQNYNSRYYDLRWKGQGTTNEFPRFSHVDGNKNYSRINDMVHIEDGSYLRLKNIQVGYTLSSVATKKLKISKARFYMSAQNLFTFTKYSGFDPEIGWGGAWMGFDRGAYPQARTFLLGVNLTI